jgi:hypothetical protein
MAVKHFAILFLFVFWLASTIGTPSLQAGPSTQATWSGTTWSGSFQSRYKGRSPFTLTVVINPDADGNLVGVTNSAADCFVDTSLQLTVKGAKVVLAGSDPEGNSITFEGTLDNSGTILSLKYILNGKCELDNGTGTLSKR